MDIPDRIVFDLDPSDDDFARVRQAALTLKDVLDEIGLAAYAKTTGSRGIHVYVPIKRDLDFDTVRDFARESALNVVERNPEKFTVEQRKNKRGDRVFIDVPGNAYGKTTVAPYSVRLRPGAPISMPVTWDMVEDDNLAP